MNKCSLPPKDLPSVEITKIDRILRRLLEESTTQHFCEACVVRSQALLSRYEWDITTQASSLTLMLVCPHRDTNWQVFNNIELLGSQLKQIAQSAKIPVCLPTDMGSPYEIAVDEISVYRDSL